ncbi:MAG: hypothetical protein A2Y10_04020 [Planctomycetes bacterium GWF2_41_51]|nr:MAG: hypothetical protein A2Y10_04020 [Planctomycetes bacterium GWF2_41_51]HBG26187.1 hypothetical protein [Phycisphaerales bacterium]
MEILINDQIAKPYVTQIEDQLSRLIRRQELKPGEKIPSIRTLASQSNVSIGIVKQAIRSLVLQGYLRSHGGRGVFVNQRSSPKRNVAVVLPALLDEHIWRIIAGIKHGLIEEPGELLILAANYDFRQESDIIAKLDKSSTMGALIYPPPESCYLAALQELMQKGIPFVQIDTVLEPVKADSVAIDGRKHGLDGMKYLLENGHTKIGIIAHSGDAYTMKEIRAGIDDALQMHKMSLEHLPFLAQDPEDMNSSEPWAYGQAMTIEIMNKFPKITALLILDAHMASGALLGLKSLGLSVPEDVSILSLGNMNSFMFNNPSITAMDQPYEEIGRLAANQLLERIAEPGSPPKAIRLESTLLKRDSVRCILEQSCRREQQIRKTAYRIETVQNGEIAAGKYEKNGQLRSSI